MRKRFLLLAALLGPAVTPSVHALNDVYEIWYITHNEAKDVNSRTNTTRPIKSLSI